MATRLAESTWASLYESGLQEKIVEQAGIKDQTTDPETRELFNKFRITEGFVIPYADLRGRVNGHYRIRALKGGPGPKYLQPRNTGNRIYLPPGLPRHWAADPSLPIVITEGEKKALAGAQAGLVCIGVGGVSSWRSRTLRLPPGTEVTQTQGGTILKLDEKTTRLIQDQVAPELTEITWTNRQVTIVYDSDSNDNDDVQNAAFELAVWLEDRGADVGQFLLLPYDDGRKCGLDDFLKDEPDGAERIVDTDELTFPAPANVHKWVAEELDSPRTGRMVQRRVARVAIGLLDRWGRRYRDTGGTYYFFDTDTKILHPFRLDDLPQLRSSTFGALLTNELGIHTADSPTMSRFADMFATQHPVSTITPHRAVTTVDDTLYYQVSDGRVARVSSTSIEFVDNGEDDVLFLPDIVEPIDEDHLMDSISKYKRTTPLWLGAIESLNLDALHGLTYEQTTHLLTTLFYLSPWLHRWRRLMTPLEVAVAEPNSGKTFLYNLRKGVLTGRPDLEGLPDDFRGWVSAVSAAPALWVCDNLGGVRSDFWHRLNDELARLITDPHPSVELRQLYTTASVYRVPIQAAFAVTTIKNPFTAPDILQRSLIYHLRAIPAGKRDANWYNAHLRDRTTWVAEHLLAVQAFFRLVDEKWNDHYLSGFRLVNLEQSLLLMGEALGLSEVPGAVAQLPQMVSSNVAEYDPVVEALAAFVEEWNQPDATIGQVIDWVQLDAERRFVNIKTLDNSILLGRYIGSHTYDIEQSTGIRVERKHNQQKLIMPEREDAGA